MSYFLTEWVTDFLKTDIEEIVNKLTKYIFLLVLRFLILTSQQKKNFYWPNSKK